MDWIISKVSALFGPKYIGATVRAVIQVASGMLIALGLPEGDVTNFAEASYPVLVGLVTWFLSWVWSIAQKKKHSD